MSQEHQYPKGALTSREDVQKAINEGKTIYEANDVLFSIKGHDLTNCEIITHQFKFSKDTADFVGKENHQVMDSYKFSLNDHNIGLHYSGNYLFWEQADAEAYIASRNQNL